MMLHENMRRVMRRVSWPSIIASVLCGFSSAFVIQGSDVQIRAVESSGRFGAQGAQIFFVFKLAYANFKI